MGPQLPQMEDSRVRLQEYEMLAPSSHPLHLFAATAQSNFAFNLQEKPTTSTNDAFGNGQSPQRPFLQTSIKNPACCTGFAD